jgi:hypothetical protein
MAHPEGLIQVTTIYDKDFNDVFYDDRYDQFYLRKFKECEPTFSIINWNKVTCKYKLKKMKGKEKIFHYWYASLPTRTGLYRLNKDDWFNIKNNPRLVEFIDDPNLEEPDLEMDL